MSLPFLLLMGFLIGMKHATEPDHLAAVATLASGQQTLAQTMRQGVAWGVGHTITLMLFGGMVLVLGKSIPPTLEQALEFAVALMLIALGADVLAPSASKALRQSQPHAHAHVHPQRLPLRALTVGMVHGMAGSAALILLSLDAVQSYALGLVYIALFGLGSIVGMALLSVAIAVPLRLSASARLIWLHKGITVAVGILSFLLGIAMAWRVGFVQGLFA
jgi:hypothetical protein